MNIEPRDPRWRYGVQTTKPELEGKRGTVFSLSNGLRLAGEGVRGLVCLANGKTWGQRRIAIRAHP